MGAQLFQGCCQAVCAGRLVARSVGRLVGHQANQVREVHAGQRLLEVAQVPLRHQMAQRSRASCLCLQETKDLTSFFQEASLLGFGAAELHHQRQQLRAAQTLDDRALPFVQLGRLLNVLHVAVGACIPVLTMTRNEVDAWPAAYLRVAQAPLAGQHRKELSQRQLHGGASEVCVCHLTGWAFEHGDTAWAAASSAGGHHFLMVLLGQMGHIGGEAAHIALHGVLLVRGHGEAGAAHAARGRAPASPVAGTHLLRLLLDIDERVAVLQLKGHGADAAKQGARLKLGGTGYRTLQDSANWLQLLSHGP
mmetsp:Transcript_53925/g.120633  ORF Transcript_53925/g.120633 Transcript_53925/m.120633 type:complete len:307 (-) Transcript_53925:2-922(-)